MGAANVLMRMRQRLHAVPSNTPQTAAPNRSVCRPDGGEPFVTCLHYGFDVESCLSAVQAGEEPQRDDDGDGGQTHPGQSAGV